MTVVNIELIIHSSIINFSKKCSYATLLAEPGFQVSTLEYLLGGHVTTGAAAPAPPSGDQKPFSFRNCKCKFVDVITITDELVLFFVISLLNRSGRHQLKYHQPFLQVCRIHELTKYSNHNETSQNRKRS